MHEQIKLRTKLRHNALLSPKSAMDGGNMTIMSNSSGGSPRFSNTMKSNILNIMVGPDSQNGPPKPRYAEEPETNHPSLIPQE